MTTQIRTKLSPITLTEDEAYRLIKSNSKKILEKLHKIDKSFKIADLSKVCNLGFFLGISNPYDSFNDLYKFIRTEWDYLSSIGCSKPYSYSLSSRGIVYILKSFNYQLEEEQDPIIKYSETEALKILLANKSKIDLILDTNYYFSDLKRPRTLASVLGLKVTDKTQRDSIYNYLYRHWDILALLGCHKTPRRFHLSYRGVIYLIDKAGQKFKLEIPEDLDKVVAPKSNVVQIVKKEEAPVIPPKATFTNQTDNSVSVPVEKEVNKEVSLVEILNRKKEKLETELKKVSKALELYQELDNLVEDLRA